ncbi:MULTISPECIES: hypothetical protein [Streptomyces]|uniref:Uncharacterized protein n=1 Tax=Streptomyces rimosus subsp. rimosus (strain ATCC 10970 / DSM 40260 / JCM 4667 / NRRL 2234) TaxID=1265868 RepID=A0A8A1V0F3_STRR1|nr:MULTISPECIES: hypothetical protein [Streptomyces]MYT43902.1 hypothetical protein [Streptomyces sp. SID5471]QGY70930.1 hypothetical protein V519_038105 [Streptomyces rimosus R6-500]QST84204.1 hypothetical protein SRIM_032160 [Streptomyces rimosus subsp. rimosus ATCC 10970]QTL85855.1 hypothetical protein FMM49_08980 [Streptomyces rimosus subsp. rimosus]
MDDSETPPATEARLLPVASGRRYGRAHVLDVLEERFSRPVAEEWEVLRHRGTAVQAAAKATA